jgi:hypothetical protein
MMMGENNIYRFGILCNGYSLAVWQTKVIEELLNQGHIPVVLIVDDSPFPQRSTLKKISRYTGKNGLYNFYERFVFNIPAKEAINMEEALRHAEVIRTVPENNGFSQYFDADTVAQIKECAPDFLLRFGFNIIRGEILESAPMGVWSYHHDDELKYRGGPPAFWEIVKGDPVNGVILQKLTNRLDGGIILKKGYFKTTLHSYSGNLNRVLLEAAKWPAEICRQLASGQYSIPEAASKSHAPVFKKPGNMQMVKFLYVKLINRIQFHYQELLQAERWNLMLIKQKKQKPAIPDMNGERISLPKPAKNHFHADPFLVKKGNRLHILFEDFDYKRNKGVIGYFSIDANTHQVVGRSCALEMECHLAYPYMFVHENIIYCIPELSKSGAVELFSLDENSGKLNHVSQLLKFPGVDPTLFFHDEKWWLFVTHAGASNEQLHVFYSENLQGPYIAHPLNPVKTDIQSARPGGRPEVIDGKLYRPVQMNSGRYGASLAWNEIETLTTNSFSEKTLLEVSPLEIKGYKQGLHTWCRDGEYLIVDGKDYGCNRYHFLRNLKRKFR